MVYCKLLTSKNIKFMWKKDEFGPRRHIQGDPVTNDGKGGQEMPG